MAQDIVGGLFGMQQQPDYSAQDYRTAVAMAEMNTPKQMGRFLGGMIGAPVGRAVAQGIGGLFGIEDPRLKRQKLIAAAQQQGLDSTTPEGAKQIAEFFRQNGDLELATRAAMLANDMAESQATVAQKLREKAPKVSEIVDQQKWNLALQKANGNEALAAQLYQQDEDARAIAKAREMRPVTNVSIPPGEKQYDIDRAKMDVDTVKDYQKAAQAAAQELPNIAKIDELAKTGKLYTGPLSDVRTQGANFLVSAGLATKDQATKVSNNAEFTAAASAGVLARIKKLGVNPTDADRAFAERMGPLLATNPQAITQVNDYLRQRANESIAEAKRVRTYADKNKGLSGFEFNPNISFVGQGGGGSTQPATGGLKSFYK